MDDTTLHIWVDAEHIPILIRLSGTLNQATAVNVVPALRELIADRDRDFDLETRALCVPDAAGVETLVNMQRTIQHSGGHLSWDGTTR